jgi:hypothetical protein
MAGIGAALAAALLVTIVWLSGSAVDLYLLDRYFVMPAWRLAALACFASAAAALLVAGRRGS